MKIFAAPQYDRDAAQLMIQIKSQRTRLGQQIALIGTRTLSQQQPMDAGMVRGKLGGANDCGVNMPSFVCLRSFDTASQSGFDSAVIGQ